MVDKIENKSKILTYLLVAFFAASPIDYIMPHFGSATVLTIIGLFVSAFAAFMAFGSESARMTSEQVCILLLFLRAYSFHEVIRPFSPPSGDLICTKWQ